MIDKETPHVDQRRIPFDTARHQFSSVKYSAFIMGLSAGIAFTMGVYALARTYFSSKTPVSAQQCAPLPQVQTLDAICGSGQEHFMEIGGEKFYSRMDGEPVDIYCWDERVEKLK